VLNPPLAADSLLVTRGVASSLDAADLLANDPGMTSVTSVLNVVGGAVVLVDGPSGDHDDGVRRLRLHRHRTGAAAEPATSPSAPWRPAARATS
jgi:hypothetical protein